MLTLLVFVTLCVSVGVGFSQGWVHLGDTVPKTPSILPPDYRLDVGNWQYAKNLTIDATQVAGDLIDFPVFISLFDQDLHDHVAQTNGNDIAFYIGTEQLDHELERFNQTYNATHAELVAWVRVPSLSSGTDTTVRMFFGNTTVGPQANSTGVWQATYSGVWHLDEDTGGLGAIKDSTTYANHGTDINSPTLNEPGKILQSVEFSSFTNQSIEIPHTTSLNLSDTFSVETWIYSDQSSPK
jgi:hypothetical protein